MSEQKKKTKKKRKYEKPKMQSESLMGFGASCNGMQVGGRKATTGGLDPCSPSKLLS